MLNKKRVNIRIPNTEYVQKEITYSRRSGCPAFLNVASGSKGEVNILTFGTNPIPFMYTIWPCIYNQTQLSKIIYILHCREIYKKESALNSGFHAWEKSKSSRK